MSDFLDRLTRPDGIEPREIEIGGEKGVVHFRRLRAGEREQILKGVKIQHVPGSAAEIEIDLADNERQRQLLVLYCVVREDGSQYFKNLEAVKKLEHHKLAVLARHAEDINREEGDAGEG